MFIAYDVPLRKVEWGSASDVINKLSEKERNTLFNFLINYYADMKRTPTIYELRDFVSHQVPDLFKWDGYRLLSESNIDTILLEYLEEYREALKDWAMWHMHYIFDGRPPSPTRKEMLDEQFKRLKENNKR